MESFSKDLIKMVQGMVTGNGLQTDVFGVKVVSRMVKMSPFQDVRSNHHTKI